MKGKNNNLINKFAHRRTKKASACTLTDKMCAERELIQKDTQTQKHREKKELKNTDHACNMQHALYLYMETCSVSRII